MGSTFHFFWKMCVHLHFSYIPIQWFSFYWATENLTSWSICVHFEICKKDQILSPDNVWWADEYSQGHTQYWATESFCWADQYVPILKFAPGHVYYSTTDVSGGMFNNMEYTGWPELSKKFSLSKIFLIGFPCKNCVRCMHIYFWGWDSTIHVLLYVSYFFWNYMVVIAPFLS